MRTFFLILVILFTFTPFVYSLSRSQTPNKNTEVLPIQKSKDSLKIKMIEIVALDTLLSLKKQENTINKELVKVKAEVQKKEIEAIKKQIENTKSENVKLIKENKQLKNTITELKDSLLKTEELISFQKIETNNRIKDSIENKISYVCKKYKFLSSKEDKNCKEWIKVLID